MPSCPMDSVQNRRFQNFDNLKSDQIGSQIKPVESKIGKPTNKDPSCPTDSRSLLGTNAQLNQPPDPRLPGGGIKHNIKSNTPQKSKEINLKNPCQPEGQQTQDKTSTSPENLFGHFSFGSVRISYFNILRFCPNIHSLIGGNLLMD